MVIRNFTHGIDMNWDRRGSAPEVGIKRVNSLFMLKPNSYMSFKVAGLLLYLPNFADGGSDYTQFIRRSSGHMVTWFPIVSIMVWMVTLQKYMSPSTCECELISHFLKCVWKKNTFCRWNLAKDFEMRSTWVTCDSMVCILPGSSVHGISQARILEWVAISFSKGSSWSRDQTCIFCVSCIGRPVLYH